MILGNENVALRQHL